MRRDVRVHRNVLKHSYTITYGYRDTELSLVCEGANS